MILSKRSDRIYSVISYIFIICFISLNDFRPIFLAVEFLFLLTFSFRFIQKKSRFNILSLWSLIWLMTCALSALSSFYLTTSITSIISIIQILLVINLLFPFLNNSENNQRQFFYSYISAAFILIIRFLFTSGFVLANWTRIGTSFGYNANNVGSIFAFASCFSLFLYFYDKKYYYILLYILFSCFVILSGSRTSLAIWGIQTLSLYLSEAWLSKNIIIKIIALLEIVGFIGIVVFLIFKVSIFYNLLGFRIETFWDSIFGRTTSEGSTQVRLAMIKEAYSIFREHPFLGIGLGSNSIVTSFHTYAHNNYIELLSTTGIMGILIYYSIFLYCLICAKRTFKKAKTLNDRRKCYLVYSLLLSILIGDLGTVSYYSEGRMIVLVIIYILSHSNYNKGIIKKW